MAAMGRRRTTHHGLPPHMAQKGESYYYVKNGKPRRWLPLGDDYPIALGKWAVLEGQPIPDRAHLQPDRGLVHEGRDPGKAPRTQRDNEAELANLEAVFGASVIDTITPVDVATYRASRWSKKKLKEGEQPKLAKTRANREIALLSDVFNFARERGFTTMPNPCTGVERNQERGRDRYPEDEEFDAIYAEGDELLQDAMDLLYFHRPAPERRAQDEAHGPEGRLASREAGEDAPEDQDQRRGGSRRGARADAEAAAHRDRRVPGPGRQRPAAHLLAARGPLFSRARAPP
jgi:hypothetical protein